MAAPFEPAFAAALLDPNAAPPPGIAAPRGEEPARRFAIYRNNVVGGLVAALAERFPVVEALVGAEFFRAMAGEYVRREPPRSPLLLRYGETFPAFVEGFRPAASLPYLADMARLELACGRAYHAADAEPLSPEALALVPPEHWPGSALLLHPSVNPCSSRHPVVAIWQAHQAGRPRRPIEWEPQEALVARRELQVEVHRLPPGGHAFLVALADGMSIAAAAASARRRASAFDLAACFGLVIAARIIVAIVAPQPRRTPGRRPARRLSAR